MNKIIILVTLVVFFIISFMSGPGIGVLSNLDIATTGFDIFSSGLNDTPTVIADSYITVKDLGISGDINITGEVIANEFRGKVSCTQLYNGSDSDFCVDSVGVGGNGTGSAVEARWAVYLWRLGAGTGGAGSVDCRGADRAGEGRQAAAHRLVSCVSNVVMY